MSTVHTFGMLSEVIGTVVAVAVLLFYLVSRNKNKSTGNWNVKELAGYADGLAISAALMAVGKILQILSKG